MFAFCAFSQNQHGVGYGLLVEKGRDVGIQICRNMFDALNHCAEAGVIVSNLYPGLSKRFLHGKGDIKMLNDLQQMIFGCYWKSLDVSVQEVPSRGNVPSFGWGSDLESCLCAGMCVLMFVHACVCVCVCVCACVRTCVCMCLLYHCVI